MTAEIPNIQDIITIIVTLMQLQETFCEKISVHLLHCSAEDLISLPAPAGGYVSAQTLTGN